MSSRSKMPALASVVVLMLAAGCNGGGDAITGAPPVVPPAGPSSGYLYSYSCDKRPVSGRASCPAKNAISHVELVVLGGNDYDARETMGSQRTYHGTMTDLHFDWTTTNSDGSQMTGSWTFASSMHSFGGTGTYTAIDGSYEGTCIMNGVEVGYGYPVDYLPGPGVCARLPLP